MKQIKKLVIATFVALSLTMICPALPGTEAITAEAAVRLSQSKMTAYKGQKYTLKIRGTKKKAKWSSSKKSIATVNQKGKITAKKVGSTTITAKIGKKKYRCKVKVKELPSVPVTKFSLKESRIEISETGRGVIHPVIYPSYATNRNIKWEIDDSRIATITNGVVTAKKAGFTTVKAKCGGIYAWCLVIVKADTSKPNIPNDAYAPGTYEIGKNLPAGQYTIFNGSTIFPARFQKYSGNALIAEDTFNYNSIITVINGQTLKIENGYAVPASSAEISTAGEGMFRVGRDIPAGEYKLTRTGLNAGYFELSADDSHTQTPIIRKGSILAQDVYVRVSKGNYLKLKDAKATRVE